MAELAFDFDWLDPEGARGAELRATWARLRVQVDGTAVTRVLDETAQSVREDIYGPLYPLAEWIATHWWQILYEVQTPHRRTFEGYEQRHSMMAGREGFALPNLSVEPLGESVRLRWEPLEVPHAPIEFLSSGIEEIAPENLVDSLSDLVGTVAARLESLEVTDTPLQEEWSSVNFFL